MNPGFVKMGLDLGKERLFSYINLFGFGNKTGIDLNGEATGILFNLNRVKDLELATTAFGQGVSVTPIQQVTAVSAVVNGGKLYTPYVVKNFSEPETNMIIKENKPKLTRTTITNRTSEIMRYALESVVARGGGKYAYIDGYRIGGKTGTAQKVQNGKYLINNYIMSFMAVVPSNNPKAVLYVAIDNTKKTSLLSSYTTAPVARRILLDIIEALNIEKQDNGIEKIHEWNDPNYMILKNVIGKSPKEASRLLYPLNIEYSGNGNVIVEQSPIAGTKVETTSTVRLMLGN